MKTNKTIISIDEYTENNKLNTRIYEILLYLQDCKDNGRHKLKRDPLEIFNESYAICKELQGEKHPETTALQIWERLRKRYLSYETSIIFSCVYVILYFEETNNPNMNFFLNRIIVKIDPIYFLMFEPLLKPEETDTIIFPENFDFVKIQADKIDDPKKRKIYYENCKMCLKRIQNTQDPLQQIENEIDFIEQEIQSSNCEENTADTAVKESPQIEMCMKLQTATMLELFKQVGITTANTDKTKLARLISALTGNGYNNVLKAIKEGINFTNYHNNQIEEINKILEDVNTTIRIKKDKQY